MSRVSWVKIIMLQRLLSLSPVLAFCFGLCGTANAETPAVIGEVQTYTAESQDTFAALAERFNTGYVALIAANPGIDPWLPGAGTQITIPSQYIVPPGLGSASGAPHEGIVVNLGELRLYYYPVPNGTPESYAIGIGREGKETPHGQTTIVRKVANPVWYPTANTRADKPELPAAVPAGDDNPLGLYALYLGWPTYLIHGTNNSQGVGRQASRGCMRLYPDSIERLFKEVPVGTKVTVIDEPVKFAWLEGGLYMSIFPSTAQIDELEDHNSMTPAAPPDLTRLVLAAAGEDAARLDWATIRKAADERRGYPVRITNGNEATPSEPPKDDRTDVDLTTDKIETPVETIAPSDDAGDLNRQEIQKLDDGTQKPDRGPAP